MPEKHQGDFAHEWVEFLNEVRVALPGVQILFAFLLSVPFSDRFSHLGPLVRYVYMVSFLCTTGASAFLIAPSVYHRLHWRRDVGDKEQMFRTCNRLAIAGVTLLAVAMSAAVFLPAFIIFGTLAAAVTASVVGGLIAWLWFGLPLTRRLRESIPES